VQERKKRRIVLASILKPVDDTRMFEKMATTLVRSGGYEVDIVGYPSTSQVSHPPIRFVPFKSFKRVSIARLFAKWRVFSKAWSVRPDILVFNTHELMVPAIWMKILLGTSIIYDVRENHYRNILHSGSFPFIIRWPLALLVRFKEKLLAPMIDHFILAEKGYEKEFRFHRGGWTVVQNKAQLTSRHSPKPRRDGLSPNPSPEERGNPTRGWETAEKMYWDKLKVFSRDNRKGQTQAESIIWQEVRAGKLGHKIRRQHAIGVFIADFVCLDKRLVIEIDGEYHKLNDEYDQARTAFLKDEGFDVMRFTNDEVMGRLDSVIQQIKSRLDTAPSIEPSQSSLSSGERLGEASLERRESQSPSASPTEPKFNSLSPGEGRGDAVTLLFTGTLAASTGVFNAITLAKSLHKVDPSVKLKIIGYAAQSEVRDRIINETKDSTFIELTGIDKLVPHEEIVAAIYGADAGIISYPPSHHTLNSHPTKLYEYLCAQLPIMVEDRWPWIEEYASHEAFILVDFAKPDAARIMSELKSKTFYTTLPVDVTWEHEARKLLEMLEGV
jgi:very-short-patch-repair endonuclease